MDELVIDNVNLIYYTLKKLKMYHLLDEYYDVGMIGLVKASRHYSANKGKFSTYACKCIANEVLLELRKQKSSKRDVEIVSLNQAVYYDYNGSNDITLEDVISSEDNIEEMLIEKEQYRKMYQLINNLDETDRELIKSYYGIGRDRKTQMELAECNHLSQAQICRNINSIIKHMRKEVETWTSSKKH